MSTTTTTTTTAILNEPAFVTAKVTYTVPPPPGVQYEVTTKLDPKTGKYEGTWASEVRDTLIENVRGKEDQYTLDKTGFQFYNAPAKYTSFGSDEEIKREYYPESIELFKKLTGASRVVIFDHTIRRRNPGQVGETADTRQPAAQAHIDQSTKASIARVHRHLPADEAPALLEKRFQIVNLWRPIHVPALEWPLALCDYYTSDTDTKDDIVPIALVYGPDHKGEVLGVRYNPNHKWKYLKGMSPEEIVLIKCFDSIQDESVAVYTPHTSFEDPSSPADAPLRQSIELRALVFYD